MAAGLVSAHEFDLLVAGGMAAPGVHVLPEPAFRWLEARSLGGDGLEAATWLKPARWRGRRALRLGSHVGVVQAADGSCIEILPKVGKLLDGGAVAARQLLVRMLCCLPGFRHLRVDSALLRAARMPLPEVFIAEFLAAVQTVVKRGLRGDYRQYEGNLPALRGKLLVARQLRHNLLHPDRFFSAHEVFSSDRAENRLLHAALRRVLASSTSPGNQRLARELAFVFADIPASTDVAADLARLQPDRSMVHYIDALAWARLLLAGQSPTASHGSRQAPSLLFPMEALFEAFVAASLPRQLPPPWRLLKQAGNAHLALLGEERWFRLRPDLQLCDTDGLRMLLDTKWKLLDTGPGSTRGNFNLSEADFYQLHAYGHGCLQGSGELALVYPRTDAFTEPLVFTFPSCPALRLWVLPFCLSSARLLIPDMLASSLFCTNAS